MPKKITKIEVIKAGSNPDIDTDFKTDVREHTIQHIKDMYGERNFASINTFNKLAAKAAFKQLCTIYNIPFSEANRITALIPEGSEGINPTLTDLFDKKSDFYEAAESFRVAVSGDEWAKIVDGAQALEGRIKSVGQHPCGIIISAKPLDTIIPLRISKDSGETITQWEYEELEDMGLIKFDALSLDTIDLIHTTLTYIIEAGKEPPNIIQLFQGERNDKKTFNMLAKGETTGIFQLSSDGMKKLLMSMKCSEFDDIVAANALYRPGPMGMGLHNEYAERKKDVSKRIPVSPEFKGTEIEKILEKTYGSVIYQESVMSIAQKCAGFTSSEADALRKAMGKKKMSILAKYEKKFKEGMLSNPEFIGKDKAVDELWHGLIGFSKYAFNKCLHGATQVHYPNGLRVSVSELYKKYGENPENLSILSMFPDGSIKPHKVRSIKDTGWKPVYTIITESGRKIQVTKDHRMLTDSGYFTIADGGLKEGTLLATDSGSSGLSTTVALVSVGGDELLKKLVTEHIERIHAENRVVLSNSPAAVELSSCDYIEKIDELITLNSCGKYDKILHLFEPESNEESHTYDIEMELDGPANFIANGLVSHNSHSVAYGLNAYASAYLKAHYPVEFMAALISHNVDDKKKVMTYLKEARRMGIKIKTVDINRSGIHVAPDKEDKNTIIYGFDGLKGLTDSTAKLIVQARGTQGFTSVEDCIKKCREYGLERKNLYESLALAGAFDSFGVSRKKVVENIDSLLKEGKKSSDMGLTLFDSFGDTSSPSIDLTGKDYPFTERIKHEANTIGLFITEHPMSRFKKALKNAKDYTSLSDILRKKGKYNVVAALTDVTVKTLKRGGSVTIVQADDGNISVEMRCAPHLEKSLQKWIYQDKIRKLYEKGERAKIDESVKKLLSDTSIIPLPPLENNTVYKMEIESSFSSFENQARIKILKIKPVIFDINGEQSFCLPLKKKAHKTLPQEIKNYAVQMNDGEKEMSLVFGIRDNTHDTQDIHYCYAIKHLESFEEEKEKDNSTGLTVLGEKTLSSPIKNKKKKKELQWPPEKIEVDFSQASHLKEDEQDYYKYSCYKWIDTGVDIPVDIGNKNFQEYIRKLKE